MRQFSILIQFTQATTLSGGPRRGRIKPLPLPKGAVPFRKKDPKWIKVILLVGRGFEGRVPGPL